MPRPSAAYTEIHSLFSLHLFVHCYKLPEKSLDIFLASLLPLSGLKLQTPCSFMRMFRRASFSSCLLTHKTFHFQNSTEVNHSQFFISSISKLIIWCPILKRGLILANEQKHLWSGCTGLLAGLGRLLSSSYFKLLVAKQCGTSLPQTRSLPLST